VYPKFPETFWSFKHALTFIGKKATNPPLGCVTVAAMLPAEWNKKLIDLNVTALTDKDIQWADMVFVSGMSIQKKSAQEVIQQCKRESKVIVAGGPLFTYEYDHFPQVDHFILNEAEITLPQFLKDLENGTPKRFYQTDEFCELSETPVPEWSLLDLKSYDSMSIQFSRGCPFNCDFCNVTALLGHRPRTKSAAQLIAELDSLYALGWRRNVFIVDDNFIGNKKILKEELLPALIEWRKDKKGCGFITEASINLADDEELMNLMAKAGFHSVFVGIETPAPEGLRECHKSQNCNRDLVAAVHRLQYQGLQVMGGFIVGFDSDTPAVFDQQIKFIQESGIVTAMVGLLQAPFGTRLFSRLEAEGRLLTDCTGDNTDGTSNIKFRMDNKAMHAGYQKIIKTIYTPKMFYKRVITFLDAYHPNMTSRGLYAEEIRAFLRSIFVLGLFAKERSYYWKLFFRTLFKDPKKFPLAITMAIYGYHFRKLTEKTLREAQQVRTKIPVVKPQLGLSIPQLQENTKAIH
jgi:radical SAM superfamily enzyme YgiQ (UPF0313 family)